MTRLVCVVGLVFFAAGLVSADESYTLKFDRSARKGDKFVVAGSAVHEQTEKASQGENVLQDDTSYGEMTFEGEVEILEVDANGYASKATCTVRHCLMTTEAGGEAKEALAEGTILTETIVGGKKSVTSDKGEVAPGLVDLLDEFLPCATKEDGGGKDAMFGAQEPRKVGDVWPINAQVVADGLGKKMGSPVDPANVKGDVKLVDVVEHEGMQCTALHMEAEISGVHPPLPEGTEIKKSDMSLGMDLALPLDASLPKVAERSEMTWELSVTVQDPKAGKVDQVVTVHHLKEVERIPVK